METYFYLGLAAVALFLLLYIPIHRNQKAAKAGEQDRDQKIADFDAKYLELVKMAKVANTTEAIKECQQIAEELADQVCTVNHSVGIAVMDGYLLGRWSILNPEL